jgi:hypothetical protein
MTGELDLPLEALRLVWNMPAQNARDGPAAIRSAVPGA